MALTDNLVSYWKLDESSGNAADSVSTNTFLNKNSASYVSGLIGNGLQAVVSSNKYLYMSSPTTALQNLFTGDFTLSGWVKITSEPTISSPQGCLFGGRIDTGVTGWANVLYSNDGSGNLLLRTNVRASGTTEDFNYTVPGGLGTTSFHYVVFRFTASSHTHEVFLDNTRVINQNGSVTPAAQTNLGIGVDIDGAGNIVNGILDEVGMWSRKLTDIEISTLYNSGSGLQYPFVTTDSISVSDSSTVTEAVSIAKTYCPNTTDSSAVTESVTNRVVNTVNVSDSSAATESVSIVVSVAVAVSGTVTPHVNEQDIVSGGKTIILTVENDTWVASGATFDAQRQNIINGLTSAGSDTFGWNNTVKALQGVAGVVRTSNTIVTITLDAQVLYNISANEVITVTVPSTALAGGVAIVATPTFTVFEDFKLSVFDSSAATEGVTTSVSSPTPSISDSSSVTENTNMQIVLDVDPGGSLVRGVKIVG